MLLKLFIIFLLNPFTPAFFFDLDIEKEDNFRIDTPDTKNDQHFRNIEIVMKFPGFKIKSDNPNKNNIMKMKKQLMDLPILLGNLIYINGNMKDITYDKKILERFKISLSKKEDKKFKKEKVKADLLILIKFIKKNKRIALKELYQEKDGDDTVERSKCSLALIEINSGYDLSNALSEDEFRLNVIREIFRILGFRKQYLKRNHKRINFNEIPYYLIKDSYAFKSYEKYLRLSDREYNRINTSENINSYKSSWNESLNLHDIMSEKIYSDSAITELTTNLLNDLEIYSINKCDIFKYGSGFGNGFGCLKPGQDCLEQKEIKNYFLEYGIYDNKKIRCYLNSKDNIKNKQCGKLSGNLANVKHIFRFCPIYKPIRPEYKIHINPIPELDFYESQTLRLLRNSKLCPIGFPRAIFFSVPQSIFTEFSKKTNITSLIKEIEDINKNILYDEVVLSKKDKNFFVTYQAYEDYYSRESVMKVINNSGIIRSYFHLNTHNLLLKAPGTKTLKKMGVIPEFQKIFSNLDYDFLTSKAETYLSYKNMKKKYPNDYNYLSDTYLYPEEKDLIEEIFKEYEPTPNNLWLIKPKQGSLGRGIHFFKSLRKIPNDFLLSRYINNPHLINNKKYDFRIYVLVTGLAPLKLYMYKEGIVRFATKKYSLNVDYLDELYRHITNVDLNKKNKEEYKYSDDADTDEGSKWSLQVYEQYCKNNGINYKNIRDQMVDISIKSFLSVHEILLKSVKSSIAKDNNFFQLYGFDFLLDENLKVHLIEINDRPSLLMSDINDRKLKPQMVADCLNIIGIIPYSHNFKDNFVPYDYKESNYFPQTSKEDKKKMDFNNALCEFGRPRGRFELIFPVKESINNYKKFFKVGKEENELLWEYILEE